MRGQHWASTECIPCDLRARHKQALLYLIVHGLGETPIPCQADANANCSVCTNKPAGSVYIGLCNAMCVWDYPCADTPCPVGYYKNGSLCVPCPLWSTTQAVGSVSFSQCPCMVGVGLQANCTIPSPYTAIPPLCGPLSVCDIERGPFTFFPFPSLPPTTGRVHAGLSVPCGPA